jgi:hypothetical protein
MQYRKFGQLRQPHSFSIIGRFWGVDFSTPVVENSANNVMVGFQAFIEQIPEGH